MVKLKGERVYLGTLERGDCRKFDEEFECDFNNPTGRLYSFQSIEKSDEWFDSIKKDQGNSHIWLGVYLNNGTIIGFIDLHEIDEKNRSCSIGMEFSKLEYRNRGYGKEALKIILEYVFIDLGMERISATTSEMNISAQKSLKKMRFMLEGKERKAVYFAGKRYDKYIYGLLVDEYRSGSEKK